MKLEELTERYRSKEYPHYIIMYGEEQRIIDEYINILNPIYFDTVNQAYNAARVKSEDRKVFAIIDDIEYTTDESAQKIVANYFKQSKHILILRYNKIDCKTKFYLHNKDYIVEFTKLSNEILCGYIKKELPDFTKEHELITLCNNDYGRILLEIDKIKRIQDIYKCTSDCAFIQIRGQITEEIGDIIFDFTNKVLYGDVKNSLSLLEKAKQIDISPIAVATILYNGFRNLLLYQGLGKDKSNAKERTGLTGWQIKQCIDLVGGYTIKDIQRNMTICQQVESGIKMGKIDTNLALDYLVTQCLI